jgi:hypothetical protein
VADLNGTWLGTYWQQGEPTRFEATLVQSGTALSGNILDDGGLEAGVSGEVVGRRVEFTKRYLADPKHLILYSGTISEQEDRMQGKWLIEGRDSGEWEAHRSGDDLMMSLRSLLSQQRELVSSSR